MIKLFAKILIGLMLTFSTVLSQAKYPLGFELTKKPLLFGLETISPKNSPKVALVLSGGGSRGIAQIGVIKSLETANINFDLIVGTSMGSIIGGLYSSGYTINDIDSILTNTNWESLLSANDASRNELFLDNKITEDRAIISVRFDGIRPVIPTSLSSGQRVLNFLNELTFNAPLKVKNNFGELKNDFYAVSTNLVNGNSVLLHSGSLSKSIRASSSVSFFLAPVKLDSLLLADGGLVANVPVNIAKKLGADYILAINTTSALKNESELNSPLDIADQVISIPISIITKENLKNANFLITPNLRGKRNNDFSNLKRLTSIGYRAASPQVDNIKKEINSKFQEKVSDDLKYFKNFYIGDSDNNFEKKLNTAYSQIDSVSNRQILSDITKFIEEGDISNFEAFVEIENSNRSHIRFTPQFYPSIENINVKSESVFLNDFFSAELNKFKGNTFNPRALESSLLESLRKLRKKGYSLICVDSVQFANNNLTISLDDGILDSIIIEGNTHTEQSVILRELPFESGSLFRIAELEEGLDNLRVLNLFDEVDATLIKEENKNILKIKVIEKIPVVVRFGLKIDNEYYSQFLFDIRNENFRGSGTEFGANILIGPRNRFIYLEHKTNRIFNTYLTYKLKGFYLSEDISLFRDKVLNSENFLREKYGEYRQSTLGLSLAVGMQIKKIGSFIIEAKYQKDKIDSILNSPNLYFSSPLSIVKTSFNIDTQDRIPFPRKGIVLNTYYETAQSFLGSEISYTKFYFDYKTYFTIKDVSTFKVSSAIGFADETLPLSQQFSFGGQNNFFGYNMYDYRGRQIFISSLEYQYLLPVKLYFDTYIKLRYDLGSIWTNRENIKLKDLRHGMGISIAFDTPIGPADFSIGKSFLLKEQIPDSKIIWGDTFFYLTIGYYY
ncbi:MAG: BamA/TamA family outer membrane protein [Ignavibacteriales bacterium]